MAAVTAIREPLEATSTGSTTRLGRAPARARDATAATVSALGNMPVFTAATAMSSSTAVSCAETIVAGIGNTSASARVFCALTAETTEAP